MQILLIRHAKGATNPHPKQMSRQAYKALQRETGTLPLTQQGGWRGVKAKG